jgi:hypothetical protein
MTGNGVPLLVVSEICPDNYLFSGAGTDASVFGAVAGFAAAGLAGAVSVQALLQQVSERSLPCPRLA